MPKCATNALPCLLTSSVAQEGSSSDDACARAEGKRSP